MSSANLLPISEVINCTFATNGKSITEATVRGDSQLTVPIEISKVNGQVTCVIPQFTITGYGEPSNIPSIISFRPGLDEKYRPSYDISIPIWFCSGAAPGVGVVYSAIVHADNDGIINICSDPFETAPTAIPLNSLLVSDTVLSWKVNV